ncbi:hypothetical protein EV175_005757 [Coemansia sp. RSA 1933]|nr:hypothetical protein EV175_005757 [Coemansia sp. RSA 1933]
MSAIELKEIQAKRGKGGNGGGGKKRQRHDGEDNQISLNEARKISKGGKKHRRMTRANNTDDLFQELFGSDPSDCNDDTALERLEMELAQTWRESPVPRDRVIEHPVPGLVVYRKALDSTLCGLYFKWLSAKYFPNTPEQSLIGAQGRINQGMHFGALSDNQTPFGILCSVCTDMAELLLPPSVAESRGSGSLFDQAIINLYDAGEGIHDHIDLMRFEDGIVGFSFGGSATMRLGRLHSDEDIERASRYARKQGAGKYVTVRLDAGDIYAMAGDARYRWTHGFPEQVDGCNNVQSRRISVTLRKLK